MQPWIQIRQQLYRQLELHVRELVGPDSEGTAKYRQEYEKELRGRSKPSDRDSLLRELNQCNIVLIGDFHALQQSQKAQLRVLKSLPANQQVVLGMECFEIQHQEQLDRLMAGLISERDFLKSIQWQKNWGFPWEHYRPLVRWAQKKKIPLFGLNKRMMGRSAMTLRTRDRVAAAKIAELRAAYPEHQIFVTFGDLHLAAAHLPAQIQRAPNTQNDRIFRVFQNPERLYFQLLKQGLELDVDVVKLSRDKFCLLNVPPWVKWQNYLLFLESHLDRGIGDGAEFSDEVAGYIKVLEADLAVKIPEGNFSIHTPMESGFWDRVSSVFSEKERKWLQGWVERGASFYIPEIASGFLARASVNHAAGLAMAVLHAHLSGWSKTPVKMPDQFVKLIWLETVQYFGTKLINPKRKTDTLADIKSSLAARLPSDQGKEALQLALTQKMSELLWISGVKKRNEIFKPRRSSSYQEAARLLGGMLGEKLFWGYRQKIISLSTLISLIKRPVEAPVFEAFYYETIELIEGLPEPFLSKNEKL